MAQPQNLSEQLVRLSDLACRGLPCNVVCNYGGNERACTVGARPDFSAEMMSRPPKAQYAADIEDGAETRLVCGVTEITDVSLFVVDNMANDAS